MEQTLLWLPWGRGVFMIARCWVSVATVRAVSGTRGRQDDADVLCRRWMRVWVCLCRSRKWCFWAGGGRKHAMFVCAGPWPGLIVTTAVAGGMLPWCVFLCVHVCIFNCQRKCEQSNILDFFFIYFLCARREHITCMLCSENITKGPVCACMHLGSIDIDYSKHLSW